MIHPSLQAELRAKFNPDGSELRQLQLHLLDILRYINRVCRENNIQYCLSSGTCLGAVRHGGFIPWDDDLDVEMTTPNYRRFLKAVRADKDCPFDLQTRQTDPEYIWRFAKLRSREVMVKEHGTFDDGYRFHGAYVDIFRIEPSAPLFWHRAALKVLAKVQWWRKIKPASLRRALRALLYVPTFGILDPCFRLFRSTTLYRHAAGSPFLAPRRIETLLPSRPLLFEGETFMGPADPHAYLTDMFGDYAKLPNIEGLQHLELSSSQP